MRDYRPYVIYPAGWPRTGRARAFKHLDAARKAAQRLADETGQPVRVHYNARWTAWGSRPVCEVRPRVQRRDDGADQNA